MIQRIIEDIEHLKIGLLGFRHECFIPALKEYGLNYTFLKQYQDIDETFDLVVESGVYDIIPEKYLSKPKYGVIGIHESPMPEGRGHAPLQWAVLNKRPNLTISLYRLNSKVDSGEIIYQQQVEISKLDTYRELEEKRQTGIVECFRNFLAEFSQGVLVLREQTGASSYHKKRQPINSHLDSTKSLDSLWDSIRICDNINYPAYFYVEGKKIILRYEVSDDNS
tara:strand:- start:7333 stop:8001 length:669 start_codon:yes stop_codon:yes gene_type:complete